MDCFSFLSVSPNDPFVNTYDPSKPRIPHGYASLYTFGGTSSVTFNLPSQSTNNEVVVGLDPVPLADNQITDLGPDIFGRCAARLIFKGFGVSTKNQYLVVFALNGFSGATAQFFIGTTLVRAEEISGQEQAALVMDCPGDEELVTIYCRLANDSFGAFMGFGGVQVFLL